MVIMGFDLSHKMTKYCIGPFSFINPKKKKREMQCEIYSGFRLGDFKREIALLSKNTGDPTVGSFRDKKGSCSTWVFVSIIFKEFSQTPRGRGFSLLGFYSLSVFTCKKLIFILYNEIFK